MSEDLSVTISQKYDELRSIGDELAALTGREPNTKKRAHDSDGPGENGSFFKGNHARISIDADAPLRNSAVKRPRLIYDDPPARRNSRRESRRSDSGDEDEGSSRPTVASSVRMPIETKSRDEIIAEQKKKQREEDGKRNRRMFGNLLGTLKQFQQETKAPAIKTQVEKLREVEEKLEQTHRQDKEDFLAKKKEAQMKYREKEVEIQRLKQRRAIQAKCTSKVNHYKRLQNFIQTDSKPAIFFLPARHTLRTMELLKSSARNIDVLIKEREEEAEAAMRELDDLSDGEIGPAVRSAVKVVESSIPKPKKDTRPAYLKAASKPSASDDLLGDDIGDDSSDDDVLQSVVVVKKPAPPKPKESESQRAKKDDDKKIIKPSPSDDEKSGKEVSGERVSSPSSKEKHASSDTDDDKDKKAAVDEK
uniref:Pinin_SDK_memA domain-containing protein n=1 Tax=Panagrellus redivivus TaxID=6233 RepID=A0A7E4ZY82_PANRE